MTSAVSVSLSCALQLDLPSVNTGLGACLAWCPLSGLLAVEEVQDRGFALRVIQPSSGQVNLIPASIYTVSEHQLQQYDHMKD